MQIKIRLEQYRYLINQPFLFHCLSQFSQNKELLEKLLATHPRTLVEASPRDRIWGIGLGASNPMAQDRKHWQGRNLLGQILTEVREQLREETIE